MMPVPVCVFDALAVLMRSDHIDWTDAEMTINIEDGVAHVLAYPPGAFFQADHETIDSAGLSGSWWRRALRRRRPFMESFEQAARMQAWGDWLPDQLKRDCGSRAPHFRKPPPPTATSLTCPRRPW